MRREGNEQVVVGRAAEASLDLCDVLMVGGSVCRHASIEIREQEGVLGRATSARHAGDGVDHDGASRQPGADERGETKECSGRIAARIGDATWGGNAPQLRQTV